MSYIWYQAVPYCVHSAKFWVNYRCSSRTQSRIKFESCMAKFLIAWISNFNGEPKAAACVAALFFSFSFFLLPLLVPPLWDTAAAQLAASVQDRRHVMIRMKFPSAARARRFRIDSGSNSSHAWLNFGLPESRISIASHAWPPCMAASLFFFYSP